MSGLPENLKRQLEEHTAGGYIFSRVSADGGVEIFADFDDELNYLAVISKTRKWIESMDKIDSIKITNQIIRGSIESQDEEYGEEDDEDDGEWADF